MVESKIDLHLEKLEKLAKKRKTYVAVLPPGDMGADIHKYFWVSDESFISEPIQIPRSGDYMNICLLNLTLEALAININLKALKGKMQLVGQNKDGDFVLDMQAIPIGITYSEEHPNFEHTKIIVSESSKALDEHIDIKYFENYHGRDIEGEGKMSFYWEKQNAER